MMTSVSPGAQRDPEGRPDRLRHNADQAHYGASQHDRDKPDQCCAPRRHAFTTPVMRDARESGFPSVAALDISVAALDAAGSIAAARRFQLATVRNMPSI